MWNKRKKQAEPAPAGDRMETYAELAKGFEVDRELAAERSERRAWYVAGGSVVAVVAMAVALAGLTPLHRIEPFVVRVDKATGNVEAVSRLNQASRTENEAVDKYMVAKYVRAREEFSRELAPVFYKTVALMSAGPVAQAYHEWFKPSNPQSPLKVYAGGGTVNVRIMNVSFVSDHIASVRYEKTVRANNVATRSIWQAMVTYRYSNAPMSEDDRLVNPVGFEVTDFRTDPEVGG